MDSASDLEPSETSQQTAPRAAPSFAQVARKISGAASNLLAMALVLLLGLLLGREVISWWRADELAARAPATREEPLPRADSVQVGIGADSPLVLRSLQGDRTQALAALAGMAREELQAAPAAASEVSAEEERLLTKLSSAAPREETPAGWIYEMRGDVPLTIGVAKPKVPRSARRVVFCGLALDKGENIWNLYGLQRRGDSKATNAAEIPWPTGTQRVMSLASGARGSTLVFVGSGDEQPWVQYYRDWFAKHQGHAIHDWQLVGTRWQATYQLPSQSLLVELFLCPQADGRWSGLVTTRPLAVSNAASLSTPE